MKYLDIILKAAAIALFITNISNTISMIGFGLYCLFQQSGVTFFSYGTPKNMMHKAKDMDKIDEYIHKHNSGKYTITNITQAISETYPEIEISNYYNFAAPLKMYKNYLSYKNISATYSIVNGDQVELKTPREAITYQTFFSHETILHMPKDYIPAVVMAHNEPEERQKKANQYTTSIIRGYPRHLQFVITHTALPKSEPQIDLMLQIGNQYKFRAKMETRTAQYYGLAILSSLSTIFTPLALIPTTALLYTAMKQYQPDDYFTLNIGFDPKSPASSLYVSSLDTSTIQYSLGAILLNIIINILFFASFGLFGAINIFSIIPMYSVLALTVFTLYDRCLVALELSPSLTRPTKSIFIQPHEDDDLGSAVEIRESKPYGFNIPTSISSCIRMCHYKTYELTHLI